jgi:hypothetical protein
MKGVPGALANAAMQAMTGGMQKKINQRLRKRGGMGGAPAWDGGPGAMPFGQVAAIAEAAGLPGKTFAEIAIGESSLNPRAVGHDPGGTTGLGLWQITTGYNDELIARLGGVNAMFNPHINARAAKEIFDSQGYGAWYGTSHVTAWDAHWRGRGAARGGKFRNAGEYANGGYFNVKHPTMFTAGESGSEDVIIKPANKGHSVKGKGGGVQVHIAKIENHREGDIKKQIEKEFSKLGLALSGYTGEDDLL